MLPSPLDIATAFTFSQSRKILIKNQSVQRIIFFFTSNIYFFTIQYISWLVFLVSIHIYKYRTSNFSCERVSTLHINKCTVLDFDRIAFGASVHLANMLDHDIPHRSMRCHRPQHIQIQKRNNKSAVNLILLDFNI